MSESFAFCSCIFVLLASRIGHERVELSSTGLDPALSFRTHRHRRLRLQLDQDRTRPRSGPSSISISNRISVAASSLDPDHVHEMCRVLWLISALSRLGDLSKRLARSALSESRSRLSDRNCELSANTPRGLETCSGVIGHSYLH